MGHDMIIRNNEICAFGRAYTNGAVELSVPAAAAAPFREKRAAGRQRSRERKSHADQNRDERRFAAGI